MGHRILAGVVAAAVGLSAAWGCAQVSLKQREPGAKLVTFPGKVAEEYKCSERRLPFFEVEASELTPYKIRPGSKLQHRFIYVMCPSQISGVIPGTLYTRIHYRGKPIYTNMTNHELQPGRCPGTDPRSANGYEDGLEPNVDGLGHRSDRGEAAWFRLALGSVGKLHYVSNLR